MSFVWEPTPERVEAANVTRLILECAPARAATPGLERGTRTESSPKFRAIGAGRRGGLATIGPKKRNPPGCGPPGVSLVCA